MKTMYTQLKILLLLLVVILVVVVFERAGAIEDFLNDDRNVATVLSPVTSFFGISKKYTSTPIDAGRNSVNSVNSTTDNLSSSTVNERTYPLLICIPDKIEEGEKAIIMWACRDEANSAKSNEFDTDNNSIGSARIKIDKDTTIKIDCVSGIDDSVTSSASCNILLSQPMVNFYASPEGVGFNKTTRISWSGDDISYCKLTSDSDSLFVKEGARGDVVSHPITKNTVFTLTCDTDTGTELEQILEVTSI